MPRHATSCPTQVHKGRKSFLVGAVIHSVSDRPASAIHCGFFLTVMNGGGGQAVGARGVPGLPPSTPAFSTALRLPIMVAEVTGASVRIPHSPPSIPVCPPRPWPSVQTCPGWLLRAQVRSWPRLQRWETLLLQSLEGAGGLGLGSRPPRLLLIHRLWFGPRVGGEGRRPPASWSQRVALATWPWRAAVCQPGLPDVPPHLGGGRDSPLGRSVPFLGRCIERRCFCLGEVPVSRPWGLSSLRASCPSQVNTTAGSTSRSTP